MQNNDRLYHIVVTGLGCPCIICTWGTCRTVICASARIFTLLFICRRFVSAAGSSCCRPHLRICNRTRNCGSSMIRCSSKQTTSLIAWVQGCPHNNTRRGWGSPSVNWFLVMSPLRLTLVFSPPLRRWWWPSWAGGWRAPSWWTRTDEAYVWTHVLLNDGCLGRPDQQHE